MAARLTILAITAIVCGCRQTDALPPAAWPMAIVGTPRANLTRTCVDDHAAGVDYFPDKVTVGHARSFRVSYHGSYKVIEFVPDIGSQETVRYVLVQCGAPVPDDVGRAHVVQVPVRRFVLAKPEFASLVTQFEILDELVGVSSIVPIADPQILNRHRRGDVHEVGSGTHSSIELALAVRPDVVFTFYSAFADSNTHPKLWDVGILGVPLADHFESTPLGRSEWMKFVALFFNRERQAELEFAAIESRYQQLSAAAARVARRPAVLLGWPNTRQQWALNGGRNYVAQMIADAGGKYVWDSPSMRSLDLTDYERIFDLGGRSDGWFGNHLGHRRLSTLVGSYPQLRLFGPLARAEVFNNERGRLPSGATPMATESLARPDAVLADLIHILHPELMRGHALRYYYELE
jgi:iron complex transport system substrate-binding protein